MPKRPASTFGESDHDDNAYERPASGQPEIHELEVVADIIRMILARIARNLRIRNEHVHSILQALNSKSNLKHWLLAAKVELESIYGLTLDQHGSDIVVISNLNVESDEILHSLCESSSSLFDCQASRLTPDFLIHKSKRDSVCINTPETVMGGIILLIISILVLSENKISENDLVQYLSEFGISGNLSIPVPLFNKPVQSLLGEITRRDYIKKISLSGADQSGAFTEYSMGERCKREIDPQLIYDYFLAVYKDENVQDKICESMKRCFPEFDLRNEVTEPNDPLVGMSLNSAA